MRKSNQTVEYSRKCALAVNYINEAGKNREKFYNEIINGADFDDLSPECLEFVNKINEK